MRRIATVLLVLFSFLDSLAQDRTEYSYAELFEMIAAEEDTIFQLKDALVIYNPATDSLYGAKRTSSDSNQFVYIRTDTIFINKEISLNNVDFPYKPLGSPAGLNSLFYLIRFKKEVKLKDCRGFFVADSQFDKRVSVHYSDSLIKAKILKWPPTEFYKCLFKSGLRLSSMGYENFNKEFTFLLSYSKVHTKSDEYTYFNARNMNFLGMEYNQFLGKGDVNLNFDKTPDIWIKYNEFPEAYVYMTAEFSGGDFQELTKNSFGKPVSLVMKLHEDVVIDWQQFQGGVSDQFGFYIEYDNAINSSLDRQNPGRDFQIYADSFRYVNEYAYNAEMKLRGKFHDYFKLNHNTAAANEVFIEIKDIETARLGFLYSQTPNFRTFFRWKVNEFLKLFSDYGTDPSKAIVFAVYVIAFFAAIYLFFPNSWDAHGRTRIMDRYRFFLKYLNRKEGASEVYHEEKEKELMPFHEFRDYLEQQGKTAPRFFYATALPLYKWSVSGSRLSGWFLSKIDVLNGRWSEVPEKGRFFKSVLVIGAFIIALLYDLFIKVLNAVMLSINTFTTLGFGEIPIKGLPRYLAIIQGFIGWFMLTIFSVSLISQLLN